MCLKVDEIISSFVNGVIKGNSNLTLVKDVRFNSRNIWWKKANIIIYLNIFCCEKANFRKINNSGLCLVHLSFFCEVRNILI